MNKVQSNNYNNVKFGDLNAHLKDTKYYVSKLISLHFNFIFFMNFLFKLFQSTQNKTFK